MAPTKVEAFDDWLLRSRVGKIHIYHTGSLLSDRGRLIDYGDGQPLVFEPCGDVDAVGRAAMDAFVAGRVYLFQRKLHDHVYQYIAMKRYQPGRNW